MALWTNEIEYVELLFFFFFLGLRKMSMWNKYRNHKVEVSNRKSSKNKYMNHKDAQEPIIYNRVIKIQYNLTTFS